MSLDVWLKIEGNKDLPNGPIIFLREDGRIKEVSQEEWNERFPEREPVVTYLNNNDSEVFDYNITHNLNQMADAAGLYESLWRPDENGITHARQLIKLLEEGLSLLQSDPGRFRKFEPSNGWGTYEGLVRFVQKYLAACMEWPGATVHVSR